MSGTLISSLVWVPRGKAALQPKRYTLDDEEIERVGKLGGPGVLEKLREEMEGMDMEGGDWEEYIYCAWTEPCADCAVSMKMMMMTMRRMTRKGRAKQTT